jgi:hypothetical protein
MRILKFKGDKSLAVRASNLSRLFFVQEFGIELDKYLTDAYSPGNSEEAILESLHKVVWAMLKTENFYLRKSTPDYKSWDEIECGGILDCADDVFAEIKHGFAVPHKGKRADLQDLDGLTERILAISLHMGLGLDDLNELTMQTYLEIAKSYAGKDEDDPDHRIGMYSKHDLPF